ncbi:hypothetical protein [Microbulbifer hydrolyticus]|uniref:Uncharacterized protein n=1 Tax=Microbulbifer hydrolyticus TaxID=48074 RepID=A0A6P1TF76_9GAMM|nr:hypothetical protein [Microbulbifer hydrolyticus]MBB5210056.1 hypothetical protein [Microbulbifer hydrolyticus]QHQ39422.1 hypothetical protein GTQ55_10825 [Microbulbifer hydrolyticus]
MCRWRRDFEIEVAKILQDSAVIVIYIAIAEIVHLGAEISCTIVVPSQWMLSQKMRRWAGAK